MRPLRILQICAEFVPLAKVGGLADVTAGLSRYLCEQGHEVVIVLPRYGSLPTDLALAAEPSLPPRTAIADGKPFHYCAWRLESAVAGSPGPTVYVVDCPEYFASEDIYAGGAAEARRFMLLSQAALELCEAVGFEADIVHCHDWHASPATVLLRSGRRNSGALRNAYSVLTLHNIGYQGIFPLAVLNFGSYAGLRELFATPGPPPAGVNFLRAGIIHADALTTVSPTYAEEIQRPEFGMGLEELLRQRRHRLAGILNGVDYTQWDPGTDGSLEARYTRDDLRGKALDRTALAADTGLRLDHATALVGFVSRLAQHKGIDLILGALPAMLRQRRFACVLLGTGEARYAEGLTALAAKFPGRVAFLQAHDEHLAHRILAGGDMLLVPSLYEPCGLTQMYALRYGTVPVVRQTGGLADTIRHFDPVTAQGNGSVFRDADVGGLSWGLGVALDWFDQPSLWQRLIQNGMREDFSWRHQGPKYEELYQRLVTA